MSTTQEASSMAASGLVDQLDGEETLEEFIERKVNEKVDQRIAEVAAEYEQELQAKEERIAELESQVNDQPTVEFKGTDTDARNLWVGKHPLGKVIFDTKQRSIQNDDRLDDHDDRVSALERGEIDASDIIDIDGNENQLPIQRATEARKNNTHDFGGNKYRATFVWPEFHERSIPSNGKLILQSPQVKNILKANDIRSDNNTVRRTMQFVAKLSKQIDSDQDEDDVDFDPKDEENLIHFNDSSSTNTLVADKEAWQEFFDEQTAAVTGTQDGSEPDEEATTADDATDNVDEDVDGLMAASAVTASADDSVEDEIDVEVTQ